MISLIQLPHRPSEPHKATYKRELIAGLTLGFILIFQIGLIVWALSKEWHLQ